MPTIDNERDKKPSGPRFKNGGHYIGADGEEVRFEKGQALPQDLTKEQLKSLKENDLVED